MHEHNAHLTFFSLLQFCPDILRQESVNLGLILWSPQPQPRLFFRSDEQAWRRLKHMWEPNINEAVVRAQVSAILRGCEREQEFIKINKQLEKLYRYACNEVRLTLFRPLQVDKRAEDVFENLYSQLVVASVRPPKREPKKPSRVVLAAIERAGLVDRIRRDVSVVLRLPHYSTPKVYPFMYRNGQTALIDTLTLEGPPTANVNEVVGLRSLAEALRQQHDPETALPYKLSVVARVTQSETAQEVQSALDGLAHFYRSDQTEGLAPLLEDIRHAHPFASQS